MEPKKLKIWLEAEFPNLKVIYVKNPHPKLLDKVANIEDSVSLVNSQNFTTNCHKSRVLKLFIGVTVWGDGQTPEKMVHKKSGVKMSREYQEFAEDMCLPDSFDEDYDFNDVFKQTQVTWFPSMHLTKEQIRRHMANTTCLVLFKVCCCIH